ncbi:hypothetical protein GNI_065190 [Gregarina niphandrodes]|uniref:Integrase catalytic domain-containing protein n=1 Tax=Gregarina niphandrodes TaxID=110365 RepID=A0A023B7V1_GRENI|nr:hypothetical protein GNI_065190 [Gregarina niphandrodes]EZG67972.1 hypothetical protein GNI_065190 [Gregarina niphandrodes]|eukprot:XP_011130121.1 hypothetical protein GNI_065190 [Gregarina niphandrodes]
MVASVVTDKRALTVAEVFRDCRLYVTAPYRPQGNGVNESSHRKLSEALHGADVRSGSELREAVSFALTAQNNIPDGATGLAPLPLMRPEAVRVGALLELRFPTTLKYLSVGMTGGEELGGNENKRDIAVGDVVLYVVTEWSLETNRGSPSVFMKAHK